MRKAASDMVVNRTILGTLIGAGVGIVWVAFGFTAMLLVAALAAAGWLVGLLLERPEIAIGYLERLSER